MKAHEVEFHLQLDLLLAHAASLLNQLDRFSNLASEGAEFVPLVLSVYTPQVVRDGVNVGVIVVLRKTLDPWHNQPVENVCSGSSGCTLRFCCRLLLHMRGSLYFCVLRRAQCSILHVGFAHRCDVIRLPDR